MHETKFRLAEQQDLATIIDLLSDDVLGKNRENVGDEIGLEYQTAFSEISADPNNELIVGVQGKKVIAVLQMTYIPNLTLKGSKRAQIEGVRVASSVRGQGIGKLLFNFSLERAKQKGCRLAQLTTNKERSKAIEFYEGLGFKATHEGMKIQF